MPISTFLALADSITTTTATTQHVYDIITTDMMSGVLAEVLGMLPVVIPVTIGFIAVRKGLAFLFQSLRKA